jgi:hypothetical protein
MVITVDTGDKTCMLLAGIALTYEYRFSSKNDLPPRDEIPTHSQKNT